jgi:hypothetical protein
MKTKSAKRARVRQNRPKKDGPRYPSGARKPEDARETVAKARQRHSGIHDPQDALQPLCGTDMGLCIRSMTKGDELATLSNAWAALSAAHRNYRLLYIGLTGNPQGAAIAMVPDKMEADVSLRVDLRTHDEKVAAAKSAWTAWEAKIKALPTPQHKWALRGALNGFLGEDTLWRDAAPTATGRVAVDAMRLVSGARIA